MPFVDGRAHGGDGDGLARATAEALRKVLGRRLEPAAPREGAGRRALVGIDATSMAEAPERCAAGHVVVQRRSLLVGAGDALAWTSQDDIDGLVVVAAKDAPLRVELAAERGVRVHEVPPSPAGARLHALLLGGHGPAHQVRARAVDPSGASATGTRLHALGWLVTRKAAAVDDED
ncbi:MAG: hypothetical protein H6745_00825 [Deltaproteobacteria bacterium]|nr:hypothetical protein [Deltaproteobacteria bacterium]